MLNKLAMFKPIMLLLNCNPCYFVELYKKIIFTNSTTNGSNTKRIVVILLLLMLRLTLKLKQSLIASN